MASFIIAGNNCLFYYSKIGENYTGKILKSVPNKKVMEVLKSEIITAERYQKALAYSKQQQTKK